MPPPRLETITSLMQCRLKLLNEDCDIKSLLQSIFAIMTKIENRVTELEKEMQINQHNINSVKDTNTSMEYLTKQMTEMETSITEMSARNTEWEQSSKQMQLDIQRAEQKFLLFDEEIRNFNKREFQHDNNIVYKDQFRKLEEYVTELKCHSVKNNLIFSGLPYENVENCEQTIKRFLCNEMGISQVLEIENVHRFGKLGPTGVRPIVAHFLYRKDLELVLRNGYRLKGKFYSVNEQFPLEIEKRRKHNYF